MKTFLTLLLATFCAATGYGQTMKALAYNTTNGVVAYSGSNTLTFTTSANFEADIFASSFETGVGSNYTRITPDGLEFGHSGLAATTRTNLGLGATNIVTFAGLTNNGDITINSATASNGLLFIRRTNSEPFLGMANLIASNNTTISNETLFRVGTAEATNRSAQFGFRSTNTNGSGVAVFSVFGYNALMQIGVDASANAVIFSGGGTSNQVMTLIKSGATEFARPISFANTTNAAATRTNLGIPLPALTNTSNVTMMRALAGSTNTNQPFSGTITTVDDAQGTALLTISNGIIVDVLFQ